MKRYLCILIVGLVALSVAASDMPKQGFGVHIGYAQPTLRLNSPIAFYPKDSLVTNQQLHGLKVGVVYDGSIIKGFGCSLGLNYTFAANNGKWASVSSFSRFPEQRSMLTYHQLELFVDWQYKFEIAKETYLMLYTGPTLQYGLVLKEKKERRTDESAGSVTSTTINRYGKDDPDTDLRQLNATWGIGAGFQYKRYFIRGGYDFGLINPYRETSFANIDRYTRGRLDQWEIKIGTYIWYK